MTTHLTQRGDPHLTLPGVANSVGEELPMIHTDQQNQQSSIWYPSLWKDLGREAYVPKQDGMDEIHWKRDL
jgi:hypothetical protein